jgi:hypothetical protein
MEYERRVLAFLGRYLDGGAPPASIGAEAPV